MTTEPRTVAVCGSCLTRDNFNSVFNPDYRTTFRVDLSTNQSSMIALMSAPVDEPFTPLGTMDDYARWNVRSDLSKEFLDELVEHQPDILVLDFFGDVHFGVLRLADGRYLTDNRWRIQQTDLYAPLLAREGTTRLRWQDDEDGYLALWVDAMDRFAAHLAERCPSTRVVVHHGFNTGRAVTEPGGFPKPLREVTGARGFPVHRANQFWARLNAHAATAYGWESIDLRDEWWSSFTDHPWGAFYVHYLPTYYHRFLAQLHAIALGATQPAFAEQITGVADAEAGRVRRTAAAWTQLDAELGLRIDALKTSGPLRRRLSRTARRPLPAPPQPERVDAGLDGLLEKLPPEDAERLALLRSSADEHIAWLEETWAPRIERRTRRLHSLGGPSARGPLRRGRSHQPE